MYETHRKICRFGEITYCKVVKKVACRSPRLAPASLGQSTGRARGDNTPSLLVHVFTSFTICPSCTQPSRGKLSMYSAPWKRPTKTTYQSGVNSTQKRDQPTSKDWLKCAGCRTRNPSSLCSLLNNWESLSTWEKLTRRVLSLSLAAFSCLAPSTDHASREREFLWCSLIIPVCKYSVMDIIHKNNKILSNSETIHSGILLQSHLIWPYYVKKLPR